MHLEQDRVICYIDAMDECRQQDVEEVAQFFDDLGDLAVDHTKRFYICLSSRHYPNLKISKCVELVLEHQEGHATDIQKYIRKRLAIDDAKLKSHLTMILDERARGVFLWVVLVVALLSRDDRRGNAHEIYKRLDEIPADLSDLFDNLLERDTRSVYLRPLLQWIAFSIKPLTREELYGVLLSETHIDSDQDKVNKDCNKSDVITLHTMDKFILEASKGMVEVTPHGDHYSTNPYRQKVAPKAQFIHESVRTYFLKDGLRHITSDWDDTKTNSAVDSCPTSRERDQGIKIARCYDTLKQHCFSYLTELVWRRVEPFVPLYERTACELERLRDQIRASFAFFDHAIENYLMYAEKAHSHGAQQHKFLDELPLERLFSLQQIGDPHHASITGPVEATAFHKVELLVTRNCPELASVLLSRIPRTQVANRRWNGILYAGLRTKNIDLIRIILKHRTDPTGATSTNGWHYLHVILEGSKRDHVAQQLVDMDRWDSLHLYQAVDENDSVGIRRLLRLSHDESDTEIRPSKLF